MAMLAERKVKQKWSNDPRNTTWTNDTSRFGYQMLTKMGWSDGKGLGAKEDGSTTNVKSGKRRDNLGLGADKSNEDNWLSHQMAFDELLSKLNDNNTESSAEEGPKKKRKNHEMEKMARQSRKRVFYNRFIQSKDLSSKSKEDMACIFGQRSKSAPGTPQEQSEGEESDDSTASCPPPVLHGVQTINSGQNIQEYFAKKMEELKAAKESKKMEGESQKEPSPLEFSVDNNEPEENVDAERNDEEEKEKVSKLRKEKKGKSRKRKHLTEGVEKSTEDGTDESLNKEPSPLEFAVDSNKPVDVDLASAERNEEEEEGELSQLRKEKSRKRKRVAEGEDKSAVDGKDVGDEDCVVKKKKKISRKDGLKLGREDLARKEAVGEIGETKGGEETVKKRRKRGKKDDYCVAAASCEIGGTKSEKNMEREGTSSCEEVPCLESVSKSEEAKSSRNKEKKRQKKNNSCTYSEKNDIKANDDLTETVACDESVFEAEETRSGKKRKERKRKDKKNTSTIPETCELEVSEKTKAEKKILKTPKIDSDVGIPDVECTSGTEERGSEKRKDKKRKRKEKTRLQN